MDVRAALRSHSFGDPIPVGDGGARVRSYRLGPPRSRLRAIRLSIRPSTRSGSQAGRVSLCSTAARIDFSPRPKAARVRCMPWSISRHVRSRYRSGPRWMFGSRLNSAARSSSPARSAASRRSARLRWSMRALLERQIRRLLPRLAGRGQPVPGCPRFPRPALRRRLRVVALEPLLGGPRDPVMAALGEQQVRRGGLRRPGRRGGGRAYRAASSSRARANWISL